jgi:hypothetical protein
MKQVTKRKKIINKSNNKRSNNKRSKNKRSKNKRSNSKRSKNKRSKNKRTLKRGTRKMRGGMTKEEIKNNREKEKEMILNELRKIKQHDPNELDNYKYWKYINNKTTQIIKDKYRYNRNLNGVNDPNYSRFANVRFLEDPDRIGYLVYDTIKGTIGTNFTKDKYINKEDLEFIWPWDDEDYFPSYEEFMSEVSNPEQYTPESTEPVDQSINVELTDEEIKEERRKRKERRNEENTMFVDDVPEKN